MEFRYRHAQGEGMTEICLENATTLVLVFKFEKFKKIRQEMHFK